VLILDFNPIGNEGLANIAQGLSRNTVSHTIKQPFVVWLCRRFYAYMTF
jgi:hypothetical protein